MILSMKNIYFFLLVALFFNSCIQINQPLIDFNKLNEAIKASSIQGELGNEIIKDELSKESNSLKIDIEKLSKIVLDFNQYVDSLNNDLMAEAGGKDPNREDGRPVLYKDKKATNQIFIVENKGIELKNKIDKTRDQILSFIDEKYRVKLSKSIPLSTDEAFVKESGKAWEELKFKDMPVAAVMPALSKLKADAISSERVVLEYWKLKYK
jgi:GldM N-terminal domain